MLSKRNGIVAVALLAVSGAVAAACTSMCGGNCSANQCRVILCDSETGQVCAVRIYERPVQPF